MNGKKAISPARLAEFCVDKLNDKKAENTISLNISAGSSVTDFFVIATANSQPQLNALVSYTARQAREELGIRPLAESGDSGSGWVLLDFGTVIVHIMTPENRDKYNLEGLWGEPPCPEAVAEIAKRK